MGKQKKAGRRRLAGVLFLVLLAEVWGIAMLEKKELPKEIGAKESGGRGGDAESVMEGSESGITDGSWEKFMIYRDGETCVIYRYDEEGNTMQRIYGAEKRDKVLEDAGKNISCTEKWILRK